MIKEITIKDKRVYECENCKLLYKDKNTAKKCEDWCRKYKSCNLEITKYAINKNKHKDKNDKNI